MSITIGVSVGIGAGKRMAYGQVRVWAILKSAASEAVVLIR